MAILRSIGAVAAGFAAVVVLSVLADYLLESNGILPPATRPGDYNNGHWALAAGYRTLFNVVGGYIAARLAPSRPITHALVLGGIGCAAGIAGVVVSWNIIGADDRWYPIALVIASLPSCWLGGLLGRQRIIAS